MKRLLVSVAAVLVVGAGVLPGVASASTWSVAQLSAGDVNAAFYGVSCPDVSLCVAVGGNNAVASTTNPTGGAAAWQVGNPGGRVGGSDLPFGGPNQTYGGSQIRGVSCPTTGLCVAVSMQGRFYSSTTPTAGAAAWKVVDQAEKGPNVHMFGVSCPTESFCVAAAYGGKILTSTNPTGDSADWTVTELAQPIDLRGISCPTASLCVAVGNEGNIVTSTDPRGGPDAWRPAGRPAGETPLNGVSCFSAELCVTGSAGAMIVSTSPAAGAWKSVPAGSGLPITGIACPALDACAAFDNNADAIVSTDPTGGSGAWSFDNVIPYGGPEGNGTFGLSCPTTGLCVAVGQHFQVLTSTDPFARTLPKLPAGAGSGRPRVVITAHPAKRLDARKGGVRVGFRFRAIGRAAGFECRLGKGRFRPCKSPRRYRVGGGTHVFRVRAIAPSGVRGPRASFHFRVGHLEELPPAGSCRVGTESPRVRGCVNAG